MTTTIQDQQAPLLPPERRASACIVEVISEGAFLTYGLGVPLLRMRDPAASRGHAPVA